MNSLHLFNLLAALSAGLFLIKCTTIEKMESKEVVSLDLTERGSCFAEGAEILQKANAFIEGKNYTQGQLPGEQVYLSSLLPGVSLRIRPENHPESTTLTFPHETTTRISVYVGDRFDEQITDLRHLQGYVTIDSPLKALEFVRLKTSRYTHFLFRPEIFVEVVKASEAEVKQTGLYGYATAEFFERKGLPEIVCDVKKDYYEIQRYAVYYPWSDSRRYSRKASLVILKEIVHKDGYYDLEIGMAQHIIPFEDIPYPLEP